jgi:hypothetical protein
MISAKNHGMPYFFILSQKVAGIKQKNEKARTNN